MEQVVIALDYDPNHADALLLRAQLFLAGKNFKAARTDLENYVKQKRSDTDAVALLELCKKPNPNEPDILRAMAETPQELAPQRPRNETVPFSLLC